MVDIRQAKFCNDSGALLGYLSAMSTVELQEIYIITFRHDQ